MKIITLLLFVSSLFISCKMHVNKIKYSDSYFNHFKERFAAETNIDVSYIPITLEKIEDDNVAGLCYYYDDDPHSNYIVVDKVYWYELSYEQQVNLIYHELGHCALLIEGHRDDYDDGGCPVSIMNSYLFNDDEIEGCFIPNYDKYIDELLR